MIENCPRLTYIEPGQFDDVLDKNMDKQKPQNYKRKLSNEPITLTSLSSVEQVSPPMNTCSQTKLLLPTSNSDVENIDYPQKINFKNQIIMPLTNASSSMTISTPTVATSAKSSVNHQQLVNDLIINEKTPIINSMTSNVDALPLKLSSESLPNNQRKKQTNSNHLLTTTSSITTTTDENEVEAVQSLLILSAGSEQQNGGFKLNDHIDLNYSQMPLAPTIPLVEAMNTVNNSNSNLPIIIPSSDQQQHNAVKDINHEKKISIVDNENNIKPELNLNPIPLQLSTTNSNYNNNNARHQRHSHPTSVIIANHHSLINSSKTPETVYNAHKRTRTISASSNFGVTNNSQDDIQQISTIVSSKLASKSVTNLHSITTLITTTTSTLTTTTNHNPKHQNQILLEKADQKLNSHVYLDLYFYFFNFFYFRICQL